MEFKEQIHDYIQRHRVEIVDTLKELVKIPSVRGEEEEGAPFGRECARVLEFTQKLYESYGFATELDVGGGYLLSYCGEGAVIDTLKLLEAHNMRYCGAGANTDRAYNACRLEKNGFSVSLISVCENEFGMATETTYGSAGYNARLLMNKIKQEKQISDAVIVVFHGGNEFNPLPSPDTQDRYRLICDMGADAVIAGHTHCPQGLETYCGKPIIYSMGNFLFKSRSERASNDSWYYGYMTELDVTKSGIDFNIIPYRFDPEATKITVFEGQDKQTMLGYIKNLSEIVKDTTLLDKYFGGWAYLHKWIPQAPSDYFNLEAYNSAGNYDLICCEAHLSQAKKVFEFCFLDRVAEAKEWSEKIAELTRMPI